MGEVGWALIRGVYGRLFEVGTNSRLGAFRINTVDIIYYFGPNLKSQEKKNIVCHNAKIYEQGQISASDYLLLHAAVTIAYLFSSGM